uniref:Uncharacterized protein n=1 Tax=Rhipicephalus pulchellus TaxID=72859 RepID=L7LZR0_RHIPC
MMSSHTYWYSLAFMPTTHSHQPSCFYLCLLTPIGTKSGACLYSHTDHFVCAHIYIHLLLLTHTYTHTLQVKERECTCAKE